MLPWHESYNSASLNCSTPPPNSCLIKTMPSLSSECRTQNLTVYVGPWLSHYWLVPLGRVPQWSQV